MLLVDKKENTKRQLCQFRDRIFVFSADSLVSATRSVDWKLKVGESIEKFMCKTNNDCLGINDCIA